MNRDWESTFGQWAKPPGKTEEQRCENAIKAIRNAIAKNDKLRDRSTKVFVQGSYRNRVGIWGQVCSWLLHGKMLRIMTWHVHLE